MFFRLPQLFGGKRSGVPVPDPAVIKELRSRIPVSREEAFRWVDDDFAAAADYVYRSLGSPEIKLEFAWDIFSLVEHGLRQFLFD